MPYANAEHKRRRAKDYYHEIKACDPEKVNAEALKRVKKYQKRNPDKAKAFCRSWVLRNKFGITPEQYEEMLVAQGRCCAICKKTPEENGRALAVDHNHLTKQVRSLLCNNCNRMLGWANESIEILRIAISYLEEHALSTKNL